VSELPALPLATTQEERFCREMARHGDPLLSIRVAYSVPTASNREARQRSEVLLAREDIQARVTDIVTQVASLSSISVATVMTHWWNLALADPNEVVQYRRNCCRYCHGLNNEYQWTEGEYWSAVAKAVDNDKPQPERAGGFGYDLSRGPSPDCGECAGEGLGEMHIPDTRLMSERGKLLFDGIEISKAGVKVKLNSRTDAMNNIAKFLGMYQERVDVGGLMRGAEAPVDLSNLTQEALVGMFKKLTDRSGGK
jgi:phage terminase small subunit